MGPRQTGNLRALRHLSEDHPRVRRRIVVCLESKARVTEDRIEVFPVATFLAQLASGKLF